MSKIALEGNASGTGTFTVAAPNSNSNYTLTLPQSTGTVVVTGGAQTIEFAAGTASTPSITFTGDTNTGIFSPAADTIAFTEGGAESMRIDSSGNVLVGSTSNSNTARMKIDGGTRTIKFFDLTATGGENWIFDSTNTVSSTDVFGIYALGATGLYIQDNGNVGIGTTSPGTRLHVTGSNGLFAQFLNSTNNTGEGIAIGSGSSLGRISTNGASTAMAFEINATERARIDSSGYFYVNNMAVGGTANLHWSSGAGQFFVTSSSRRFKHDITDYDKGLAEVMQMQPKYFVYNEEPSQKQRVGFIAEDFHDLGMTEFVEYWKDENDQDTPSEIGYSNMVAILVKSIQELKAINDAQATRIETLETKVAALENK